MTNKNYNLFLHYKQGDDLSGFLQEKDNDSKKALLSWAEFMESNAEIVRQLLNIFEGKELKIEQADTHYISLTGDESTMLEAVSQSIVQEDEQEYEEED